MKINVLYIIWSLGLGGAEQVVIHLARGLDKNRFNVLICCLNDEGPFAGELQKSGIKIFALHKKGGIDFSVIGKIRKIIKNNKVALVHTHLWGANVWGRLAALIAGVPVIITEHNIDVWKRWHHKIIDRLLSLGTPKICVVSDKVKQFYAKEVGIPAAKIHVVYNGITPNPPAAGDGEIQKLRAEFHIPSGTPVLANIGRLVPAKANHVFIESVRILRSRGLALCALIIGDGPLKEDLMRANADLVDKGVLKFTGLRKDVPALLDLTDISVLSSTREGFSVVILECMAKGIPVVATDVGGNSELIIDGQTGFLVPCGDSGALAERAEKLLQNPALARQMGEEAKRIVQEKFSLERMITQTQQIYDEVLKVG